MLYSWESTIEKFSLSYHETPNCGFASSIAIMFLKEEYEEGEGGGEV